MKDIGIVTWHYYPNFGSALQAYAMQEVLQQLGYTCEFINYRKRQFRNSYVKTFIKYIISNLSFMLSKNKREKFSFKFSRFEYEYLRQRRIPYTTKNIIRCNSKYRIFLCGSDQIWAPNVFDPIYFLSFVDSNKAKVAYAASIGLNQIPKELERAYIELLRRFDCLSTREENGAQILRDLLGYDIEVVLDPTMLLSGADWQKLVINPPFNDDYIFVYFLGDNPLHRETVKNMARTMNYKIVTVSKFPADQELADFVDAYAGPKEFLGYVKNAKFVITDSFHGVCFSIIYRKDFYAYERFSNDDTICQNSRIHNLLKRLKLEERIIKFSTVKAFYTSINYAEVEDLLHAERSKSMNFLRNALQSRPRTCVSSN